MKMLTLILCYALLAFVSVRTSVASESDAYDMMVDGVKVIVQPTKANQIIAVNLGIQGGYGRSETENPAIPAMTAALTTVSGTTQYTKDQYREELSRLVTTIAGSADAYNATYSLTCARPKFDASWKIFEGVIREPRYDEEEFAKLKTEQLADIARRRQEPEGWVNFMMDSMWSSGHRAGRVIQPADVNALTLDALRAYHDKELERSRMTIVIVGDVTKQEVEKKVHELLASIPAGSFRKEPFEQITGLHKNDLASDQRVIPTTYIVGRYEGPQRSDPDYWSFRLASLVLADRLYEEVRTKRNLSYSPYAYSYAGYGNAYGQVGVSTTNPDSAMHVIVRELDRIRDSGITEKELRDTKESYITQVYMSQQSNLSQASRLYTSEIETGDYRNAFHIIDNMMKVSLADVKRAVGKYLHTVYWTAVGDQSKLVRGDFVFP